VAPEQEVYALQRQHHKSALCVLVLGMVKAFVARKEEE
jgi:hypothetical protein